MAQGSDDRAAALVGAKLSKALSSPWRSRVMTELRIRPMSAAQFAREVGGERSHIARCFRQLAEWGFIELVETRSGGRRRGAVERIYRASQRAFFDDEAWKAFPEIVRQDISGGILRDYHRRFTEARDAGTLDAEVDRHLSWDLVMVDRAGWNEIMGELNETLDWAFEVASQSAERLKGGGLERMHATLGLLGFRSPGPGAESAVANVDGGKGGLAIPDDLDAPISDKLAKALANPWRARILAELRARPMSPSEFVTKVGGELWHIARCFRQLAEWGYLELDETKTGKGRRGGIKHVYRAVSRAYYPTVTWETFSPDHRQDMSATTLESLWRRVGEAVELGTFDAELNRHLSWCALVFDRQGWSEVVTRLDSILFRLPELEAEALARMAVSGEEAIPTTVGLACFRSPAPPGEG